MKINHRIAVLFALAAAVAMQAVPSAHLYCQNFGIGISGGIARPVNGIFQKHQKSGFTIGAEFTKNFYADRKMTPWSVFGLYQLSFFNSIIQEYEPLEIADYGVGGRYSHRMGLFKVFGEAGLMLTATNMVVNDVQYVHNTWIVNDELGSKSIILGGFVSAGVGYSFVDIRIRYHHGGANVQDLVYSIGFTYSYD